jgi:hypothetical protein
MTATALPKRDQDFFEAVHGLLDTSFPELKKKYGIWRIHRHFELGEGEVFHETSNAQTKESTLCILKKDQLPKGAFASTWSLTAKGPVVGTWCCDDAQPHPTT